jgi:hypothetical protein
MTSILVRLQRLTDAEGRDSGPQIRRLINSDVILHHPRPQCIEKDDGKVGFQSLGAQIQTIQKNRYIGMQLAL